MGLATKALLFFGYLLVYASVADSGRFAAQPWQGILDDAYAARARADLKPDGSNVPPGAKPVAGGSGGGLVARILGLLG